MPPTPTADKTRLATLRRGLIGLAVAFTALAALALPFGTAALGEAIAAIPPRAWAAGAAATALVYALRFLRWHLLARRPAPGLRWGESGLVFLSGLAMALTPGKVGEALKAVELATRHGVAISTGLSIVAVELVSDLASMALLTTLLFAFVYPDAVSVALGGIGFSLVPVAAMLSPRAAGAIARLFDWHPRGRDLGRRLRAVPATLRQAVDARGLAMALGLSLLAHGGQGLGIIAILDGLGTALGWHQAIFAHVAPNLAGALAMLPASLGAAEIGMATLFRDLGQPAPGFALAVAAALACRLVNLWGPLLIGLAALAGLRLRPGPPLPVAPA